MREDTYVVMDIPPKETLKNFVKRWYGYDSCNWSEYADTIFKNKDIGSVYVDSYTEGHCIVWGDEDITGKNCIKYSATIVNNLGEI